MSVCKCFIKTDLYEKALLQCSNVYGLSLMCFPVCVLRYLIRLLAFKKRFIILSALIFLPSVFLICIINSLHSVKALLQSLHVNVLLFPVCIFECLIRLLFLKKALSHWLHLYGLSPVCAFMSCKVTSL